LEILNNLPGVALLGITVIIVSAAVIVGTAALRAVAGSLFSVLILLLIWIAFSTLSPELAGKFREGLAGLWSDWAFQWRTP
jgi:hypothetical protein